MRPKHLYDRYDANQKSRVDKIASIKSGYFHWTWLMLPASIIAVCLVLLIYAWGYPAKVQSSIMVTLREECSSAIVQTNLLSRTAGTDSSATLGRIRSHVYAMDQVNSLNMDLEGNGNPLIPQEAFSQLYDVIENYSNKLIYGMATGDQQTELQIKLDELMNWIYQLQ